MPERAAVYVDGFNLYHAILELDESFLKWCNLWRLGETLIKSNSETLVKVVFCSAYYPGDERKRWRHGQYVNALKSEGVECRMGHYVHEPMDCRDCGREWQKPTEKETDINLALSLFHDAVRDEFDVAYLITADTDQAATARFLREHYPNKKLITVAPPKRNFSVHLLELAHGRTRITTEILEACVFPSVIIKDGRVLAKRPNEYAPPEGWIHPDQRP